MYMYNGLAYKSPQWPCVHHVPKSMSYHKAIVVITWRTH